MSWKMKARCRRDCFQDSDRCDGMGDQVQGFEEHANVGFTGSPKNVQFIRKDETNLNAVAKLFKKRRDMF